MSERDRKPIADGDAPAAERRNANDRRGVPGPSRRGQKDWPWKAIVMIVGRDTLLVLGTVGAIIVSLRATHPIFTNQPSVVQRLVANAPLAPIAKAVLDTLPPDTTGRAEIVASPEFERDRKAFAADLVATGHMDPARADTVSYYAVRESYLRGIPPAVVFGVMLTENSRFISKALSNVGAVGLMQVYPKIWLKALENKFGTDLAADSTNLKYGVYILSTYIKTDRGKAAAGTVNTGLLHYNGCVKGTNTPRCKTYPSKVAGYVQKQGSTICGGKGFYECIAKPFIAGFTGAKAE
jgi:Transglycosylase SLT domain